MKLTERIFQAVLFEVLLLVLSVLIARLLTGRNVHELGAMFIIMSLLALILNVVFNYLFDKIFTGKRIERGVAVRVLHAVGFELTLMLLTTPVMAYMMNISIRTAIAANIGMTLGVMAYTFVFNYLYDHIRVKIMTEK